MLLLLIIIISFKDTRKFEESLVVKDNNNNGIIKLWNEIILIYKLMKFIFSLDYLTKEFELDI